MKQVLETAGMLRLEVHVGKYVNLDSRWKKDRAGDPYSRLYYIRSGEGHLRVDGETIRLEPGYVYLVPSGLKFSHSCPRRLSKLYFHITITATEGLDLLGAGHCVCRAPFSDAEFETLMKSAQATDYLEVMQLKLLLYKAVVDCMKTLPESNMPIRHYSAMVEQAMQYIRGHTRMGLTAREIAQAQFVSESGLRKRFREETGMTLGQYMEDLLFFRARQLLTQSRGSIGEISRELGFSDQFYFSRRFKEKFNQTPSRFRRELLGKQT